MVAVRGVDRAQDVDVHAVPVQTPPAAHHIVERSLAALVHAIGVVQLARAVHAQADEDLVLLEEGAPGVVQLRAVGLDGVGDLLSRLLVPLDVLDRALEEVEAHERRLATLPADDDFRSGLRLEQLTDVGLEELVGHPEPAAGIEHLLREEEAVLAIEVADRAGRLGQQMEIGSGL